MLCVPRMRTDHARTLLRMYHHPAHMCVVRMGVWGEVESDHLCARLATVFRVYIGH